MFGQYVRVLSFPGALLFSLTGFFARLQLSMASMGATLLIVAERDSYALAAQVTALYAISGAVISPLAIPAHHGFLPSATILSVSALSSSSVVGTW